MNDKLMKKCLLSDIRDAVKYKEVMKQYGLGPNGGIVTSLNLFSTKFQQVVSLLDQRSSQYELAIIDTPGLYAFINTVLQV